LSERRGPDLSKLSDADLRGLRERIDAELQRRFRNRQHGERARGGLLEGQAPRYRNPENPAETWSGRGPQPAWVEALRKRGVRLESLRIEDDRPVPSKSDKGAD
jgi:DNA-binding protein H-NS